MNTWLERLNEQQKMAVTAPLGNLLVLAGAGSGKTRVLVNRIAWMIEQEGLSPHAILAVTFTNKAAGEMKERLSELLSVSVHGLWVGTFHGLCHRLLRRHFKEANLPEQFHILDSDDQVRLLKRVIASLNLDNEQWPAKQAQGFINAKKDEGIRPQHLPQQTFGPMKTLIRIYQAYEQACQRAGVIDFAEILLRCHEMLRDTPELLSHYQSRFQAILVDEFQDTNTIQYAWIRLLAGQHAAVMAVGDDDQSIYGWRGAKVENIHQFSKDFTEVDVVRLEQNYRSTSTILEAANALIRNNQGRMGKSLWTSGQEGEKIQIFSAFNELEEARFVSDRIQAEIDRGVTADDIAILYRSNAQSRLLEEALLRSNISYRIYGGVRFFERAEVKDALAYLRLIANASDDSAFERVVNFPTRGIGSKTIEEIRTKSRCDSISLWDAANALINEGGLTQRATGALNKFIMLIERLKPLTQPMTLDEQIKEVIQQSGLIDHYGKEKGEKAEARLDNLKELVNAAKQFRFDESEDESMPLLVSFLAHASLEAGEMQGQADDSCVHLMTLHAAKGLEFPIVFLVGMEEGLFPGKKSIEEPSRLEEERRLCYVGMTRAMQKLVMSYAEIRRQYGREEYHRPSRFLKEIPADYVDEVRPKSTFKAPVKPSPSFASESTDCGFQLGQIVRHEKFGQGVVLAMEGSGAHTRVQVNFDEHGSKWLVLAYANLTV